MAPFFGNINGFPIPAKYPWSATANVHCAFDKALKDSLTMQDDIYKKMAAKGWYPSEQAEPQKIQKVKQKYSANATN